VDWIHLAQNRIQEKALERTVTNLLVHKRSRIFLQAKRLAAYQKTPVLCNSTM
jgi:hypothetical protein